MKEEDVERQRQEQLGKQTDQFSSDDEEQPSSWPAQQRQDPSQTKARGRQASLDLVKHQILGECLTFCKEQI